MKSYKYKIDVTSDDPDAEAQVEGAARELAASLEFGPHDDTTFQVVATRGSKAIYRKEAACR